MGSSSGGNYQPGKTPTPPNVADYGTSTPFTPSYVNFLGDTNVPSTGLTPQMLQQIDSMSYAKPPPQQPQTSPADRNLLAELLAKLQQPQRQRMTMQELVRRNQRGGGGGGHSPGYGGRGV